MRKPSCRHDVGPLPHWSRLILFSLLLPVSAAQAAESFDAETTLRMVSDKALMQEIGAEFKRIHEALRQNTEEKAAQAILAYLQ